MNKDIFVMYRNMTVIEYCSNIMADAVTVRPIKKQKIDLCVPDIAVHVDKYFKNGPAEYIFEDDNWKFIVSDPENKDVYRASGTYVYIPTGQTFTRYSNGIIEVTEEDEQEEEDEAEERLTGGFPDSI